MKKGIFITFEGVDGSGKSTHSKLLADYLRKKGYNVVHTREPGGVSIAESLREILLHPKNKISPYTELFLYLAARAQHVKELIRPVLEQRTSAPRKSGGNRKPMLLICERFSDATFAYQGYGRRIDFRLLKKLDSLVRQNVKPDLTLLLDLPILKSDSKSKTKRIGLRESESKDRLENETLSFHQCVRQGYLKLAKAEPERFRVIKVRGGHFKDSIEKTQKEIRRIVDEFLTHSRSRKSN